MSRSVDYALVQAAKKNPAHFAPLYDKYYERIFIYIVKKTQNEEVTGDLTSQVFLKAILNILKYEDRGYPFSSWLYMIATNEVNLHYRKNKKINEVEIQERDVIHLLDDIKLENTIDLQNKLVLAMNSLKEKDMQLIDLRYFENLSFKEIGDILQISHGAAKIKLYRSLDKLKKLFNSI
tara:strand:- start:168 stop:704 length:537 start_codon:yes stop_codon:yes gene_type:complete